jgi:hypothetical protein
LGFRFGFAIFKFQQVTILARDLEQFSVSNVQDLSWYLEFMIGWSRRSFMIEAMKAKPKAFEGNLWLEIKWQHC